MQHLLLGASDGPHESEQPALSQGWQARAACGAVSFLLQDHSVDLLTKLNILQLAKRCLQSPALLLQSQGEVVDLELRDYQLITVLEEIIDHYSSKTQSNKSDH